MQTDIDSRNELSPAELKQIRAAVAKVALVKLDSNNREICEENKNVGARVAKWRATLGRKLTGAGKERKSFDTEGAAKAWIEARLLEKKGYAKAALRPELRAQVTECMRRLDPYGVTLVQAVDYFIRHSRPEGGLRTFREVGEEFMTSRINADCRPRTVANYRSFLNTANTRWGEEVLSDIQLNEIEAWVAEGEWEPRTRRNYLASMSAVLGYAKDRKYCAENAAHKATKPKLQEKEIEILTPEEVTLLLQGCQLFAPDLLAAMAIGAFAGLRSSEICSLDWQEVDLETRCIEITASKAKTRQRRIVHVSDNLEAWLRPIKRVSGPVIYLNADSDCSITSGLLGYRRSELLKMLTKHYGESNLPDGLKAWKANGLRHSFGSYFLAKTKNENLVAAEMGNSPAMIYKHYRELVKPSAVEAYWKIMPPYLASNIIPMVGIA